MKKLSILCISLLLSASAFASLKDGVVIGCFAREYCEVQNYSQLDRVFVGQLIGYGSEESISRECESQIFSKYRGDKKDLTKKLNTLASDFPGFLCFEPMIDEIVKDF